jgi:large repetitive protein
MANDTFGLIAASYTYVNLAQISSTNPGVSLNANTGAVSVAAGTSAGSYQLIYRICQLTRLDNCDDGVVQVTVNPYLVEAVNDFARASSKRASIALPTVLWNDRFAGAPANIGQVSIAQISLTPANPKIQLDTSDGSVDVSGKTTSATYTLTYEICERSSPNNCSRATVTLELSGSL